MKLNRILMYLLVSGFFSLLLMSCEDEVLDLKPTDRYSEEDVWSNTANADAFLLAVLDGIDRWGMGDGDGISEGGDGVTMFPCNFTEEALQRGDHGQLIFFQGNVTPEATGRAERWRWSYASIRRANIFIENVHRTAEATKNEIAVMEAQARFARAMRYANLLEMYSWWRGENNGVPLITEVLTLSDNLLIQRANYQDVVDFIISELDKIADVLPVAWDNSQWGRPTKGACLMLKSRILLYAASKRHNPGMDRAKWQAASDAAKAVIDLNIYSLKPTTPTGNYIGGPDGTGYESADFWQYSDIWIEPSSHNEIILAKPQDDQWRYNRGIQQRSGPNGYGGEGGTCPTPIIVDKFRMANGLDINDPASGYDPNNPYVGRELRFYANIIYNGRFYFGRPVEYFLPELDSDGNPKPGIEAGKDSRHPSANKYRLNTPTGYWLYKFMDEKKADISVKDEVPLVIMRYAEAILNYAEAQFELGNEGVARDYINMIRRRGDIPDLAATVSGNDLRDAIRRERRIELAFEGFHSFCDLRRWEVLDQHAGVDSPRLDIYKDTDGSLRYDYSYSTKRTFSEKLYSFPIRANEIEKFPDLVQNPGY